MANNYTFKDASIVTQTAKATDNSGVLTPHVNVDTLPALPTGANTIGTVNVAGTVPVSGTVTITPSGTQTVSGTVAATQSGTWTVQPGNTANTTAWKVDGSAVTQPVSLATNTPTLQAGSTTTVTQATGTNLHTVVDSGTITTVSTVTNLSQLGGTAIAMGTGTRSAGTQRVTIATDDLVPVSGTLAVSSIANTISTNNSSTATLTSGSVFTGTSDDVTNYVSVSVQVYSDQASAALGLSLQFSPDNTNFDLAWTGSVSAATPKVVAVPVTARYFRVVYTNGGTNQATFRLTTIYHPSAQLPPLVDTSGDGTGTGTPGLEARAKTQVFNGTSWDRTRSVINSTDSTGTGIAAVGLVAQFDDVSPSAVTENQFGNLRMGAKRSLHIQLRDAAGNDRGANVNASNQLSVSIDGSTANQAVTGAGAAAASVSGNPVRVGVLGRTTLPTAVSSAQLVDVLADRYGRQFVIAPVTTTGSSAGTAITTNTNTSIVAAPSAGNHLRIHRLWAQNSSATGTWCYWGNGSGVKTLPFYLAQNQPFSMAVNGAWELSSATALFLNTATTGANIEWFVEYETLTD